MKRSFAFASSEESFENPQKMIKEEQPETETNLVFLTEPQYTEENLGAPAEHDLENSQSGQSGYQVTDFKSQLAKLVKTNDVPMNFTDNLLNLLRRNGHADLPSDKKSLITESRSKMSHNAALSKILGNQKLIMEQMKALARSHDVQRMRLADLSDRMDKIVSVDAGKEKSNRRSKAEAFRDFRNFTQDLNETDEEIFHDNNDSVSMANFDPLEEDLEDPEPSAPERSLSCGLGEDLQSFVYKHKLGSAVSADLMDLMEVLQPLSREQKDNSATRKNVKCCCKHVLYIYHEMRKTKTHTQLHREIHKRLPMQTREELEEFEESLQEQSNRDNFRDIAVNLTLKQFLADDIVLGMKFSAKDDQKGFKDYLFYEVWKEAAALSELDFTNFMKSQMRAAKSRIYAAKYNNKKKILGDVKNEIDYDIE
ncbi:uncharacterized protein LOC132257395 isoform X2 [Phlebotomus argentipes]|nr:uncharacterized protein LOC132257395 isoform X2 [Phlebotomus argentipes]